MHQKSTKFFNSVDDSTRESIVNLYLKLTGLLEEIEAKKESMIKYKEMDFHEKKQQLNDFSIEIEKALSRIIPIVTMVNHEERA